MERPTVSTKEASWSDLALEEYRVLHAESLERVRNQNTFVGFSLLAGTGIISAAQLWSNSSDRLLVLIAFSFILWTVILIFIEQEYQVALIGSYIKERLYPILDVNRIGNNPCWELYRTRKLRKINFGVRIAMGAKYMFLILPMLFIDLWLTPFTGLEIFGNATYIKWISVIYFIIIATKCIIISFALIQTVKEYFRNPFQTITSEIILPSENN